MSKELSWPAYGAAILCGGRSSRMGFDKAVTLRDHSHRLLLSVLARELGKHFGQVGLITNDRNKLAGFSELASFQCEEDLHPLSGPAGAIHTALKKMGAKTLFIMACDMPVVDWTLIGKMAALMSKGSPDAVVPRHGRHCEPLYAFYSHRAEKAFLNSLVAGRRSIRDILAVLDTAYLNLKPNDLGAGVFKNLNTTEDLGREGWPLPPEASKE